MKNILFFSLLFSIAFPDNSFAQDSLVQSTEARMISSEADTFVLSEKIHSPARAAMLSAAFPGLGQIYNKKYWKVPIIYAGSATLLWFINYHNERYVFWRETYYDAKILEKKNEEFIIWIKDNGGNIDNYDLEYIEQQSQRRKESSRKNRDYCVIGMAALYLANIIDANVDAYFLNFDVSQDLTLQIKPYVDKSLLSENIIGVKLSLDYK